MRPSHAALGRRSQREGLRVGGAPALFPLVSASSRRAHCCWALHTAMAALQPGGPKRARSLAPASPLPAPATDLDGDADAASGPAMAVVSWGGRVGVAWLEEDNCEVRARVLRLVCMPAGR